MAPKGWSLRKTILVQRNLSWAKMEVDQQKIIAEAIKEEDFF
jgi:hypothetical protein